MKTSSYNYFVRAREEGFVTSSEQKKYIGFNTLSRECMEFDEKEFPIAQAILAAPDAPEWESHPLKQKLFAKSFLIDDDLDEFGLVRVKDRLARFNTDHLDLAINITHNCNFRCSYCYKPPQPEDMSWETAERIIQFVEQRSKTINTLSIRWYGGEPLLKFPLLQKMGTKLRDIARQRDIRFFSAVLSNGYFLTRDKAEFLTNELNVGYIAVPLDGPAEVHNTRRPLAGGQGTFERILDNLCEVTSLNPCPPIFVRINIDESNVDRAIELLQTLEAAGLSGKIGITYGQVAGLTQACASAVDGLCISRAKFISAISHYSLETHDRGFSLPQLQDLLKPGRCIALCINSYIVAPNGDLYKCDNETGILECRVGRFLPDARIQHETSLIKWLAYDITEREECRECVFLPLCMGGCAYRWMRAIDRESDEEGRCSEWERSILKLHIINQYHQESLLRESFANESK